MLKKIKIFAVLAILAGLLYIVPSCGVVEKWYDQANYESLTNETGTIELYAGSSLIRTLKGKILHSDADSLALWIETSDGQRYYHQGTATVILD